MKLRHYCVTVMDKPTRLFFTLKSAQRHVDRFISANIFWWGGKEWSKVILTDTQ